MKYTLTIPVSTNTYNLLFGYSLTSWNDAFKFWKINSADIQLINGEYFIQPEIETANVDVPIPDQENQYNNYSINMSCVKSDYGVKCRWYVLPLCTMNESSLSWVDKATCGGVVGSSAIKAFEYSGDYKAVKLEKIASKTFYWPENIKVSANIKGIQLQDENFQESETITVTTIRITNQSTDYSTSGSWTFNIQNGTIYCEEEIQLKDNNNQNVSWDTDKAILGTTVYLTVNGQVYEYQHGKIDVIAVKTVPLKNILSDIISDEPDNYSLNCRANYATTSEHRAYITLENLTEDELNPGNYYYEDSVNNIIVYFSNPVECKDTDYLCTTAYSFYANLNTDTVLYPNTLPPNPLLFGIDEDSNIHVFAVTSNGFKSSIAPISPVVERHSCTGMAGVIVQAEAQNPRFT